METYRGYRIQYNPRMYQWSAWSTFTGAILGIFRTRADSILAIDLLTRVPTYWSPTLGRRVTVPDDDERPDALDR